MREEAGRRLVEIDHIEVPAAVEISQAPAGQLPPRR